MGQKNVYVYKFAEEVRVHEPYRNLANGNVKWGIVFCVDYFISTFRYNEFQIDNKQ